MEEEWQNSEAPQDEEGGYAGFEEMGDDEPAEQEQEQEQEPEYEQDALELETEQADEPQAMPPMPSPSTMTTPPPTSPKPEKPASDSMRKWKAENDKKIQQRDADNTKLKQDLTKKAEAALEKHRSDRQKKIQERSKANREAQAKDQAALNAKPGSGGEIMWSKMAQLVDLDKETTDRERMRLLFKQKVGSKA